MSPPAGSPLAVFIGPPAAGKTRLGKRVARILSVPFIDTDTRIVAEHGPISEIFAHEGEAVFRQWEADVVAEALRENAIVTLGGGAVMTPEVADALEPLPVVLLTVSADAVEARLGGGKRPLVTGGLAAWSALVDSRMPVYESLATARWDTSLRPLAQIAEEIATWVRTLPRSGPTTAGGES